MDRQRLLTIFGIAWLSAAALTWFLYAKTKAPKAEKTVRIVAASREMPAGTKLGKGDLRIISAIERDLPRGAISDATTVIGKALLYPTATNEPITATRLSALGGAEGVSATIEPGMRAVSVAFTDATGVSGLIQPRSRVDVLYTRTGSNTEAMTATILEDIVVLSIGRNTEVQQTAASTKAATTVNRSQNQTATVMVTPDQAKKLELAKNQGKLSLALRNPLDRSTQQTVAPATLESIDPALAAKTNRKSAMQPSLKDAQAWAKLVAESEVKEKKKEPPPKPKHVVDVFHGEKHVQEIFQ